MARISSTVVESIKTNIDNSLPIAVAEEISKWIAAEEAFRTLKLQMDSLSHDAVFIEVYVSTREAEKGIIFVNQKVPLLYRLLIHGCKYHVRHERGV